MRTTQELSDEHKAVLVALEIMEKVEDALEARHEGAPEHMEELLDFFRGFVDRCHHAKEEEILFPELERHGLPREGGPIEVMLAEHDSGRRHVRNMAEGLDRLRRGDAAGLDEIRSDAEAYRDLLRAHIEKEEQVLFPMADQVVTAEEAEQVRARFEAVERDQVGPGRHIAYHAMLDRLRKTYGVGPANP
jgi:hemerythrin-like domain-containing protein